MSEPAIMKIVTHSVTIHIIRLQILKNIYFSLILNLFSFHVIQVFYVWQNMLQYFHIPQLQISLNLLILDTA
jgi:hypothetical protein